MLRASKDQAAPATSPQAKPDQIQITAAAWLAFTTAAALIRDGYVFAKDAPPEFYIQTGNVAITLVRGAPDEKAISEAEAVIAMTLDQQRAQRDRESAELSRRLQESAVETERQARIKAEIAEHKEALLKLEQSLTT